MTRRDYRALPALIFVSAMLLVLMTQPAHAQSNSIPDLKFIEECLQHALHCLTF